MKKLYAPFMKGLTGLGRSVPPNKNKYSDVVLEKIKELHKILTPIKKIDGEDEYETIWVTFKRGSLKNFIKYNNLEDEPIEKCEEWFYEEFPKEDVWFKLHLTKYRDYYVIALNSDTIFYHNPNERMEHYVDEYYTQILENIIESAKKSIKLVEKSTYKDTLEKEVPYNMRYGIITRKDLWKVCPDYKEYFFRDLTKEDISAFKKNVQNRNNLTYMDKLSVNKLIEIYIKCYEALGKEGFKGKKVDEEYMRFHFSMYQMTNGGILEIDPASTDIFDEWYDKHKYTGHTFEVFYGSSRTSIHLWPHKENGKYYFSLYAFNEYMHAELIKIYNQLYQEGIIVKMDDIDEILSKMKGEGYVGIYPFYLLPITNTKVEICRQKTDSLIHLPEENLDELLKYITFEKLAKGE